MFQAAAPGLARREYTDVPVVAEGKTLQVSPNVYVIADENRRGVPNVGIVVGTRATLVVDLRMGRKGGEAVVREVAKIGKGSRDLGRDHAYGACTVVDHDGASQSSPDGRDTIRASRSFGPPGEEATMSRIGLVG